MISVIISTYRPSYFSALEQNIKITIGVNYEIIKIDNPGIMGISKAYNKGMSLAKFNCLCFCHEDILFHTKDWGKKLLEIFNSNGDIGLIGIAGSPYLPYVYSGWSFPTSENIMMQLIQSTKDYEGKLVTIKKSIDAKYEQVAAIDGCFMATNDITKRFDETLFKLYDCYDLDFSLQNNTSKKIIVTYEIVLEHFSAGNFSYNWLIETRKLNRKWIKYLPVNKTSLSTNQIAKEETGAYWFIYNLLIKNKYSIKPLYRYFIDTKFIKLIGLKNHVILVYKTLKLYSRKLQKIN